MVAVDLRDANEKGDDNNDGREENKAHAKYLTRKFPGDCLIIGKKRRYRFEVTF